MLDKKKQQWLALGLFMLLLLFVALLTVVPLIGHYVATANEIEKLKFRLERYTDKITSHDSVVEQVNTIKTQLDAAVIFSQKTSIPLAQAELQQRIQKMISASKAELNSTQNIAPKAIGDLTRYGVNVRFAARMQDLLDILHTIESTKPYMMIETIKILSVRGERNLRTGKIEPVDKVHVSIDVFSYLPDTES